MSDTSKPTDTGASDIELLLNRMCDATITADERSRLEELLLNDSTARQKYVEYLGVNSALAWKYRTGAGQTAIAPEENDADQRAVVDSRSVGREKGWHRLASTFFAMAVGLLLGLVAWNAFQPEPQTATPAKSPSDAGSVFLATLRDATGPVWQNDGVAVDVGARIRDGELRIESGEAEVVFDSGAKLMLAGPAELNVASPFSARLLRGTLAAHMPPSAVGFELHTPTSRLVDQGTEFGVQVDESGTTQVHVFRGQVDVHRTGGNGKQAEQKLELFDQQARMIARAGDMGEQIEFSKQPFGRLARQVAEPIEWPVSRGGNGHFYQLVVEKQPLDWHQAARQAMNRHYRGMPGHLVTLTSSDEDRFVVTNLIEDVTTRGVWIGLTDVLREGHFRWVTGEPYEFTSWASWPDQQPDNFHEAEWHGGEDYAMYTRFPGKQPWAWNDLSIDSMYEKVSAYVVEYEPPVDALRHRSMVLDPIHWSKEVGGNGHYYRVVLVEEPTDWATIRDRAAETEVLGVKGHLAALETDEERLYVAEQILRVCGIPEMMIGLSGSLEQSDLRWINGRPVEGFEVERSHLPTDLVYGVFRWNPAGKWQTGWEIRAMSLDILPDGWFGYLVEYPVDTREAVGL